MLIELHPSVRTRLKIWEDTDKFFADRNKKKATPPASQNSQASVVPEAKDDVGKDNETIGDDMDLDFQTRDKDMNDNNEDEPEEEVDTADDVARHIVGKSPDNSTWLPSDGSQYYDCDPKSTWGLIEGAHRWQAVKVCVSVFAMSYVHCV